MDSSSWAAAQEYVCAHVSTDYATFTENFCEDVLSTFLNGVGEEYLLMAHTRTDSMGDLFRLLGLATLRDDLDLDALEVAPECAEFAVKLLKAWRGPSSGIVSDKAWIYEEDCPKLLTSQPVWPETRSNLFLRGQDSARPETHWPEDYLSLRQHPTFSAVPLLPTNPPTPVLEEDDVLQLRYGVPSDASTFVQSFLHSMKHRTDNSYDLRTALSSPPLAPLEGRISPPLFTAVRRLDGSYDLPLGQDRLTRHDALLHTVTLTAVEEPKSDDIVDEHLVVVNGWHAFAPRSSPSPLPTPSLGSGSSELDELDLRSPSPMLTSPDPDAKIEPILLPRFQRQDGASLRQCGASASDGRSFGDFVKAVTGVLPNSAKASHVFASVDIGHRMRHVDDVSSLLAHASDLSCGDGAPRLSNSGWIGDVLPIAEEDPASLIIDEQHEEYHERLPVPGLPRPSPTCPGPEAMSQLLKSSADGPSRRNLFRPFLRKVVIQKSLTKDLSWMPFPAEEKIPPDGKLLDIDSDIKDSVSGAMLVEPSGESARLTSLVSVKLEMDQVLDLIQDADDGEHLRHAFLQDDNLVLDDVALRELADASILNRHDRRFLQGLPDLVWSNTNADDVAQWLPRKHLRVERPPTYYLPAQEGDQSREGSQLPGEEYRAVPAEATTRTSSSISHALTSRRGSAPPWHVEVAQLGTPPRKFTPLSYSPDHVFDTVKDPWPGSLSGNPHVVDAKAPVSKSPSFQQARVTATASVDQFLRLRSAGLRPTTSSAGNAPQEFTSASEDTIDAGDQPMPAVPEKLRDSSTLSLSDISRPPSGPHCYLASIDIIQRSALVSALKSPHMWVTLVERQDMDGADLFLDPYTAICVVSLVLLPTTCSSVLNRIARLTTRCEHLLVLFEAYSPSHSTSSKSPAFASYNAFSPPVIKAVQTLRRSVLIAVARDPSAFSANVRYGFAASITETAAFIRAFGDDAAQRDTVTDALWDDRYWLLSEESQEESDLARVDGMNAFAAATVLSETSFDHFLDMSPEVRREHFANLIGDSRVANLNSIIAHRLQSLESALPASSPLPTTTSSDTWGKRHAG